MKFQPHERIFSIFLHPATLVKWACIQRNWYNGAVSGNSTNIYSKTYRSRILTTYLPIMKNKRSKPNNPTETRTIQSRTQIAAQNSELAMIDLHRKQADYIPVNRGSLHFPAAADTPRGQERCWRGIGDRNPLSLFNRPREEQIKSTSAMRYSPLVKPIQTP